MNIKVTIGTSKDTLCKRCLYLGKLECDDECKDISLYSRFKQVSRVTDIIPLDNGKILRILF